MTSLGVDYLNQPCPPSTLAQAGYQFVLTYSRVITAAQISQTHAAGMALGLIFESTADRALGGGQAGASDAVTFLTQIDGLGYPAGTVAFTNVGDFVAAPSQMPAINAYYGSWSGVIASRSFAPGAYGTGYIIDQLVALGNGGYWWQNAMDDNGEPGSRVSPNAHIYQRVATTLVRPGSLGIDENVLIKPVPLWGKALIPNPTPAPSAPPAPVPVPIGDNVLPIPFQCTLDANGWTAIGVILPAGKTKNDVISIEMDGASPYDNNPADPWEAPTDDVDFATGPSNNIRVIVRGTPNHFYTGRVMVAG